MCTRHGKNLHPRTEGSEAKSEGLERKVACGLLLVALLIGVLAGCQTNDQPPSQVTDTLTSPNAEKEPSQVTDTVSSPSPEKEPSQVTNTLTSPNPEEDGAFGGSLASVGDLNGDGTPDLLVGAYRESAEGAYEAGRAYVFDGAGGEVLDTLTTPSPETYTSHGEAWGGRFGASLAGVGDLNGDGTPDLLVGAPAESAGGLHSAGRAYLFDGAGGDVLDTLTSPNPEKDGYFGVSLAAVGDLNGDGTPDWLVGAEDESPGDIGRAGRAYLFDGAGGDVLDTLTSPNPEQSGHFGSFLAGIGDVAGDGTPDLLVGADDESPEGIDGAGRAYLFDGAGGDVLDTLTSPNPEEYGEFGVSLGAVGDVTGDGTPDLLVGAEQESPGGTRYAGRAYLFDGAGRDLLRRLTSPNPEEQGHFGGSLAGVGDLNSDGTPDLLVGAPHEKQPIVSPSGTIMGSWGRTGQVYVFDGSGGEVLDTLRSPNPGNDGGFGASLGAVVDVTGDGPPDLLVGAEEGSPGGREEAGRVYRFDVQLP